MARNRSSAYSVANRGTILLGSSRGGENKASQTRRPCPYMVLSFVCMYMCVYAFMYMCIYICIWVYLCGSVYVYICMYTYVCIYMEFFVFLIVYRYRINYLLNTYVFLLFVFIVPLLKSYIGFDKCYC
jgi:hypothetical protein